MSFSMLLSMIHSPKHRYRISICLLWFSLLSASETTSCHDRKCNLHLSWASSWACVPAAGYQGLTMVVRLSGQRLPLGSHHLWVPNPSCHHCFELTVSHTQSQAVFCRVQECSTTAPSSISQLPCQQLPGWTRVPSSPKPQHRSHCFSIDWGDVFSPI